MAQPSCYAQFSCLPILTLPVWTAAAKQKRQAVLPRAALHHDASQAAACIATSRWHKKPPVHDQILQGTSLQMHAVSEASEVGDVDLSPSCEDQWAAMCRFKAKEAESFTDEEACCDGSSADNSTESGACDNSDAETESTGKAVSSAIHSPDRYIEDSDSNDVVTREDALSEASVGDRVEEEEKDEREEEECHVVDEHVAMSQKFDQTKEDGSSEVGSSAQISLLSDLSDDMPDEGFWARLVAPWQELLEDSALALGVISETSNSGAHGTGDE